MFDYLSRRLRRNLVVNSLGLPENRVPQSIHLFIIVFPSERPKHGGFIISIFRLAPISSLISIIHWVTPCYTPIFSWLEFPILAVTQGSYSLSALQLLVTNLHASEDPDSFGVFVT